MREELVAIADELGDPEPVENGNTKAAFVHCFRFCDAKDLNQHTVVDEKIWVDWQGNPVALLNLKKKQQKIESENAKIANP